MKKNFHTIYRLKKGAQGLPMTSRSPSYGMTDQSFGIIPFRTIQRGIEFLLIHQRASTRLPGGHWGFPKGHAEQNETPVEAALRECKEETGLSSLQVNEERTFHERYVFTSHEKQISKTVTYFTALVTRGKVRMQRKEIQDYRWVLYDEAMKLLTFPEVRRVLQRAYRYISSTMQKR